MNLDQLRELSKAATPGPWTSSWNRHGDGYVRSRHHGMQYLLDVEYNYAPGQDVLADAALIAAMRNHFEALLDVAEAARLVLVEAHCSDDGYLDCECPAVLSLSAADLYLEETP